MRWPGDEGTRGCSGRERDELSAEASASVSQPSHPRERKRKRDWVWPRTVTVSASDAASRRDRGHLDNVAYQQ